MKWVVPSLIAIALATAPAVGQQLSKSALLNENNIAVNPNFFSHQISPRTLNGLLADIIASLCSADDPSKCPSAQATLGYTPLNPANNLSEITSPSAALSNIGAQASLGFTPLNPANNLSDVGSPSLALSHLGGQTALGFTPLNPTNNLSDVGNAATALSHLGGQTALGYTPLNPANNLSEVTPSAARASIGAGTVGSVSGGCAGAITTSPITGTGTINASEPVDPEVGANYIIRNEQCGHQIDLSNASPQIPVLQTPSGSSFVAGWYADVCNTGVGAQTLTPTSATIGGNATLALTTGQCVRVVSDGANYQINGGLGLGMTPAVGALTPLATAPGSSGSYARQGAAITDGNCPYWSSGALADSGNPCGGVALHPGYISSHWYPPYPGSVYVAGAAQVINTVYCNLGTLPLIETIKSLGSYFSVGDSGGHVSWAIYANSPTTHLPSGAPIDYVAPVSTPTSAGASSGSLHNTTDTLPQGVYWLCDAQDNATGVMNSLAASGQLTQLSMMGVSAITSGGNNLSNVVNCAVSSTTCGGSGSGWSAWSSGAFTWGTPGTWTLAGSTNSSIIWMQAN